MDAWMGGMMLVLLITTVCFAQDATVPRVAKGDYAIALTANGLEASYRGVPFLCATDLNVHKPEWKGIFYSGANLPGRAAAKIAMEADRITVADFSAPIGGTILYEWRLDGAGLVVTLKVSIANDIGPSPAEYAAGILPAEVFAGGRYRVQGLLGREEWRPLPLEKPTVTGPGTSLLRENVCGVELEGKGIVVRAEPVEGPPLRFYDMRSRGYPGKGSNYWLLYSWTAGKGEAFVSTRFTASAQGPQPAAGAGTVVVADGAARRPVRAIVVDREAHPLEKAAARELQTYLARMCGAVLAIRESEGTEDSRDGALVVGRGKAAKASGLADDAALDALGPDGFVLRAKGGQVVAAGRNARGTVYAVYRLLERLGCRFYAREEEVIPAAAEIAVPGPFEVTDSAGFEWRAMQGTVAPMKCGLSPGEWEASVAGTDVPKMMAFPKGGFWHHTMGFLLPAKALAEEHPEQLALIGKERKVVEPARQQYCLSNPDLLKRMTTKVLDWIAGDPDKLYYPVHYGDVAGFCECDACKALYAEKGGVTDAVIWFDNQIAKAVAEKYPGKFVTILSYLGTRKPPKTVRPEPNLLIVFCAILECQGRPWSHPVNVKRDVCKDLEEWVRLHPLGAKGILTFDYPTTYNYAGFTYPALYAFVDNIRYYHKLGLRGVYVCGLGSWKHLEHLYSYVIPRIMWKPDQDMGALIQEFCEAWYGPAAKPMRDYIELLHRGALESKSDGVMDCHAGPGQPFFRELFTPEFTAKAYALFAQAEAEAADPLIRNRIAKEKWGLLFTDLYLNSAKPGEILPAANTVGLETRLPALDECRKLSEFLRINRQFNRPWVVNPRAWHHFSLAAFTGFEPGCEPWWSAPRLRQLMDDPEAALQGIREADRRTRDGFVVLENRELQLLVVPGVGGRIWRMYHKGLKTDLLRRGAIPLSGLQRGLPASPYLDLGGYEEYTAKSFGSPGWSEAYEGQRSAAGDSIAMTVSFPNGLKLTRAVSLVPDKAEVVVQSGIENAGAQPVKGVLLRVHPEFLPPENEKPELEVRTADGGWRKVPYEAGDNFLTEENRPHGAWALRFPKAGLRIVDEFDPAQVETCYFYSGRNCCNLELFSAQKDLAPGEKVTLNHKYALTRH